MNRREEGNIFDYINDQVNIVDVISSYVTLERAGKNHKALCPFHNEKTASFVVSEEKQLYHCFGCGAAGNSVGFIMNYENLDAIDAVEFLADRFNIDLSAFKNNSFSKNTSHYNHYYDILRDAAIFFYKNLRTHQEALAYLERRQIDYDMIKQFGIGYSSDAWAELMKHLSMKYSAQALEQVGLIIQNKDKSNYYDRFRNRIMFPIINPQGKVIGFGGRVMDDSLPKYLNSPETEVFNKSKTLYGLNLAKNHKGDKKQLIVTEGYMDVIALHSKGLTNAVATLGTALTSDHARLMKRYASEILLCYDSDFAGQNAALKSLDVLEGVVDKVRVVVLGESLDPDDYLKRYGLDAFKEKLDEAVSGTEFRINHLKSGYNLNDDDSKVEFLSKAATILMRVDNAFEKNLQIEKLGNLLGVNTDLIAREVFKENYHKNEQYGFHNKAKETVAIPKISSDKKIFLEEQLLVYWLLKYPEIPEDILLLLQTHERSAQLSALYDFVLDYFDAYEKFDEQILIDNADLSVSTKLIELLGKHAGDLTGMDIDLIAHNLKIFAIDEDIASLTKALKTSDDISSIQRKIHQKRLLKQELMMKRKSNN